MHNVRLRGSTLNFRVCCLSFLSSHCIRVIRRKKIHMIHEIKQLFCLLKS